MRKYELVKEFILDKIKKNEYKLDCQIPSERELAVITAVNRMTVRRAIEDLVVDGILITKIGSGTFVTSNNNKRTRSFIIDDKNDSTKAIKIISCMRTSGGNIGPVSLKLQNEEEFWRIRRVRTVDNIPYAYEDIYLNTEYFKKINETDFNLGLSELAKKYIDAKITVIREIEALICLKNTSVILKVPHGSPILQIKSTFDVDGVPIMFCRSNHPGYSYKYEGSKFEI